MATILPAISSASNPSVQLKQRKLGNNANNDVTQVRLVKLVKGKRAKEYEDRQTALRARQPLLTEREASQYRNSYKHNLSLDMLQDGFHKSFSEMFALIKQENSERLAAGPESILWSRTLLEDQPEKLDTLKKLLTEAEMAQRKEDYKEVYRFRHDLAKYFQLTCDKWLSDHFYNSCLSTSQLVEDDGGYLAAQGHCNVGLAQEEKGDNYKAAENFEMFLSLSEGHHDWMTDDGSSTLPSSACTHLTRIYTTIAKQLEADNFLPQALDYLLKAHKNAKESSDATLEGEASYKLGLAYEKNNDSETALIYLNGYFDTCQAMGDTTGMGKACEAMAKSYNSQDKIEESIKYLEKYVEVAERNKDDKALSQACSDLGAMFNSLGRYEQAVEFFNKSYTISRAMNDTETISSSRVLFGVAAAHKMLENVAVHVNLGSRPCLERLIEWKDNRGDKFEQPITKPEVPVEQASSEAPSETDPSNEPSTTPTPQDDSEEGATENQEGTAEEPAGGEASREGTKH